MKKALIILMFIIGTTNLLSFEDEDSKIKNEIDSLLTSWHKAAAVADEKTYFNLLAPEAIFLGTDATERWTKEEFQKWAKPYFKRESAWIYSANKRFIYLSSDKTIAWFDEELASKSYWTCRGTGVLEKIKGQWKIRHYNLTFTIPNEITKEIKPLVEKASKKN